MFVAASRRYALCATTTRSCPVTGASVERLRDTFETRGARVTRACATNLGCIYKYFWSFFTRRHTPREVGHCAREAVSIGMCTGLLCQKKKTEVTQARLELATLGLEVVRATIVPPPLLQ